jgi:hypothetical protein
MLWGFDNREVSHQYECDKDNEHVIKSFVFIFVMHIKRVSTESRRKSRLDSIGYLHGQYAYVAIPINSNYQIVLHIQGEHVHKSKEMQNKITFVWNVRKWKPFLVYASETTEDDVTTSTHVPTNDDVFVIVIVFVLVRNFPMYLPWEAYLPCRSVMTGFVPATPRTCYSADLLLRGPATPDLHRKILTKAHITEVLKSKTKDRISSKCWTRHTRFVLRCSSDAKSAN